MSFMQEAGFKPEPPFFRSVRQNDWNPFFHWNTTIEACADRINQPHEDYPRRVPDTQKAIQYVLDLNQKANGARTSTTPAITQDLIRQVHRIMFPDHGLRAGQWRQVPVKVASHIAPKWELMDNMMAELEFHYAELTLDEQTLKHWYFDFETIHPYRDGNGRAGGVIIAGLSFGLYGKFLTPGQ